MTQFRPALATLLHHFANSERAVAAVEFAMILPVMLVLYLGSIEASSLYTVDRRVTTISSTMGDLVSQADDVIAPDDIDDYFEAAEGILIPYSQANLQQVVSLIEIRNNGATKIVWSCASGGSAHSPGDSYPALAANSQMNQIARGTGSNKGYLVASETSYAYTPVFGAVIPGPINLYRESFYLPRFGARIDLDGSCP